MVCCIERLLRVAPDYTLTALLDEVNRRGLPPSAWEVLSQPLRSR